MDVAVLLVFALFFTALVLGTSTPGFRSRAAVHRPGLFQFAALCAAAATVPADLALVLGFAGGVTERVLLVNVAAACAVAALHEYLRERAPGEPAVRLGVLGWTGPLVAFAAVTAVLAVGAWGNEPGVGSVGSAWAIYSLLICVISAYALVRRRVGRASGPREG